MGQPFSLPPFGALETDGELKARPWHRLWLINRALAPYPWYLTVSTFTTDVNIFCLIAFSDSAWVCSGVWPSDQPRPQQHTTRNTRIRSWTDTVYRKASPTVRSSTLLPAHRHSVDGNNNHKIEAFSCHAAPFTQLLIRSSTAETRLLIESQQGAV